MDIISKMLWAFGFIVTIVIIVMSISYFLNINTYDYLGYLLWTVSLGIFYIILPSQTTSVFDTD